ncbi:MAG: GreA/GreB family elongation factor [Candidatus Eisenbacteria bacterium]
MTIRDKLSPILRGEDAADLDAKTRARLEQLAHDAQAQGQLVMLRDECGARLKQPNPAHGVQYLLAAACALHGEIERATQTLLALGEKLAAEKNWETLAAIADRTLELEPTQAGARLLVQAHEELKKDPARLDALERAWSILSDDLELALLFAVRLGEAGQAARRREILADLLPRFAAAERYAGLEEAALEFAEHGDMDGIFRLMLALQTVAAQGAFAECKQLLDIAFPPIEKAKAAGSVHDVIRDVVKRAMAAKGAAAGEPFRKALVVSLREGPAAQLPEPGRVIRESGLEDKTIPLDQALDRYDRTAALAPGRAVHHASFGAGRIAGNDGENVLIDFARSKNHRMPFAAAQRTLSPIADDDLRLVRATDETALRRLFVDEPATVILRALSALGGEADASRLKMFLVGADLIPTKDWTPFWRKARPAVEKDPRVDSSRAFEQRYRVAPAGMVASTSDDAPLPSLEPRKPVRHELSKIRKYLAQHPTLEKPLAQRFGKTVERAMLDTEGERGDRARAGICFSRWYPARAGEWTEVLKQLWEQGLEVSDLAGEDEQLTLLESSHIAGVEADAILSALDSRYSAVRERAERYRAELDLQGRAVLRRTMLHHATRYPSAVLRLVEETVDSGEQPGDGWRLLVAALALVEDKPKPTTAEKVLRWLEEGGAIERMLRNMPRPDEIHLKIRVILRQWRSSDRYLFPVLEAMKRLGLHEEVEWLALHRQQKTDKLFESVGKHSEDVEIPFMTRATWLRQQKELERLEKELRTTIPATIQRARELGDLKENAEYHSAKLKQANVSKLVAALQLRLAKASFVDDADYKDGVVGLGSEVTLESNNEVTSYWILGEGEHHLANHVISFRSVVGRALMGRGVGDETEFGEGEQRRRYRVVSIERRLPPAEEDAEASTH